MNQPTWAVLVLAGLAAGCELVAGIQDKYLATGDTGPQIGPSDTGSPQASDDAASSHPDATIPETNDGGSTVDALEAAAVPDAGTAPVDGAIDAGNDNFLPPDAGTTDPSAPCAMQPTYIFCDDFDTETTVGQPWSWRIFTVDGGASSFATSAYTSPPRSFEVVAPPTVSTASEMLGLDLGTLSSQIRLAFDLRIDMDSLGGLAPTAIAQILGARSGPPAMELDYVIRPNQGAQLVGYVSLDGGPALNIPLPAPPLRTWTRIVVAYDVGTGVTVFEDGQQVGANASAATGAPNDTKVQVGMIYENGSASATLQMEMDNVVVRGH